MMRSRFTRALAALTLFALTGCATTSNQAKPAAPAAPAQPAQQQAPAQPPPLVQEASVFPDAKLALDKYNGPVGTRFTMTGTGYPANQEVAITWKTFDGKWLLEEEEVVFVGPRYDERLTEIGKAKTDAQGKLTFAYTAPEDFGGVHDVFTRIEGKYATKAAFTITPTFTVTPTSGPIGTPVTIKATGLGYRQQLAQWEVAWDNGYTGYMTGVNTHGTATANIRMAGPSGKHVLKIWRNYRGIPYLNPHQGPFGPLPESTFVMDVTEGVHQAPAIWEHPKSVDTVRPVPQAKAQGGASLKVSSDRGTVGSTITISGEGFPAGQPVKLTWATRTGQQIGATGLREGFEEQIREMPGATAGADGKLALDFKVFDDYAGHHRITAQSGDKSAEAYYSIYGNISEFSEKVRVGEPVKVRLRGIGWTVQGKTYAVVFDNKYLGYVCSFSTKGYIEMDLPAEVKAGVHVIDLYPAVYEGKDPTPDIYSSPNLTYLTDHPGGTLPAFRLTLTVTD